MKLIKASDVRKITVDKLKFEMDTTNQIVDLIIPDMQEQILYEAQRGGLQTTIILDHDYIDNIEIRNRVFLIISNTLMDAGYRIPVCLSSDNCITVYWDK